MNFKRKYAGIYILIVNILYILTMMTSSDRPIIKVITCVISGFIAVILNSYMIKITNKKLINIICFVLNIIILNVILIICLIKSI